MSTYVTNFGIPDESGPIIAPDMFPGLEYPYWSPATGWISNPAAYAPENIPSPPASGVVELEPTESTVVTMSQYRIALLQYGLLDEVDAYFVQQAKSGEAGRAASIEWEYSTAVVHGAPLVNQVQAAFSWTDEFVNDLFALAKCYRSYC